MFLSKRMPESRASAVRRGNHGLFSLDKAIGLMSGKNRNYVACKVSSTKRVNVTTLRIIISKPLTPFSRLPVHQLLCDTPTAPRKPRGLPADPPQDIRDRAHLAGGRPAQRRLGGRRSSGSGSGGGQLADGFLQGSWRE